MKSDLFGQVYFTSAEVCDLIYKNPNLDLTNFQFEDPEVFNRAVKSLYVDFPILEKYVIADQTQVEDFDKANQDIWYMPDEYKSIDIAQYVLDLCKTDAELQRVGQELMLYQDRDLFMLLKFMKYLVDTLREHKIVWGVGRGSSVSSYVLYLIGVHKIDSLYYDLDISEFLK